MVNVLIELLLFVAGVDSIILGGRVTESEVAVLNDVVIAVWVDGLSINALSIPIQRGSLRVVVDDTFEMCGGCRELHVKAFPDKTGVVIAYLQSMQTIKVRKFSSDFVEDRSTSFTIYNLNQLWSGLTLFDFSLHDDGSTTIVYSSKETGEAVVDVYSNNGTRISSRSMHAQDPVMCGNGVGEYMILSVDNDTNIRSHSFQLPNEFVGPYYIMPPWQIEDPSPSVFRPSGGYSCAYSPNSIETWYRVQNDVARAIQSTLYTLPAVSPEEQQVMWFATESGGTSEPRGIYDNASKSFALMYMHPIQDGQFVESCRSIANRSTIPGDALVHTRDCFKPYVYDYDEIRWDILPQKVDSVGLEFVSLRTYTKVLQIESSYPIVAIYPTRTVSATLPTMTGTDSHSHSATLTVSDTLLLTASDTLPHTVSVSVSESVSQSMTLSKGSHLQPDQPPRNTTFDLPVILAIIGVFSCIMLFVIFRCVRKRRGSQPFVASEGTESLLVPMSETSDLRIARLSSIAMETMLSAASGSASGSSGSSSRRVLNVSPTEEFKYTIIKPLGSGTSGSVSLAMLEPSGTLMAVKQMKAHPETAKHIEREVTMMTNLSHPHVIHYLGQNHDPENMTNYIYMEYIEGGTLHDISVHNFLSESTVAGYIRQVLLGVKYIHDMGVIHRDIKCANMLLDKKGRVVLADFGCSKAANETCGATFAGTPVFMPPEIILCTDAPHYTTAVDIWSLGCSVVELLDKGQPPWPVFETPWAAFYYMATAYKENKPPTSIPSQLSSECHQFLMMTFDFNVNTRAKAADLLETDFIAKNHCSGEVLT
eukprot:TRINITY_DN11599_c1_g1_i1.p1 TRINITY_DN11599_c1_g1~~TRINITY_DN11599_c1_g1_i1.p1  ORF type:complete len:819 (+),score=89.90 TRINITY_DN11599_c1_g1_i1:126-2582(+)